MIATAEKEPKRSWENTDISSLTSIRYSEVISLRPDYTPHWLKDALITLFHIASLPENWDSYGGPTPSSTAVNNALTFMRAVQVEDLPVPNIVPVPGGGIQIEWSIAHRELELEFLSDGSVEYLEMEDEKPIHEDKIEPANTSQLQSLLLWLTHATTRKTR